MSTLLTTLAPRLLLACALAAWSCLAAAAPASSFDITVPNRNGPGQLQISALKITLQLDTSANIAVNLQEAGSGALATESMVLTNANNDCFLAPDDACFKTFPNTPAGAVSADRLTVIKSQQAGADPGGADNKLVLVLRLRSNLNEGGGCTSTLLAPETWTVSVVGGAARIVAASVQSLDKQTVGAGNPACGTAFRPIPRNDGPVASITGTPQILSGGRIGVDAVMVLDRSGSMSDAVSASPGAPTKMLRLHEAAATFIDMWKALRDNECQNFDVACPADGGAPAVQGPVDRLGVVYFDHGIKWLKELQASSGIDGLKEFGGLNLATEKTAINAVNPSGATSIGGGLLKGAQALAPAPSEPNRKIVLLMSDGQQNTDPLAQVTGSQVQTTTGGGAPVALPNQPPVQIYGVTVGTGVAVDATINQQASIASNGFYLNTEDDAAVLPNLFVQVLQNAVRFSSVETLRVISDVTTESAPFETSFPVTTGTHSLAFNLNWNAAMGSLRVRLTPPAGATPIDFVPSTATLGGRLIGNVAFPRVGVAQSAGVWKLQVMGGLGKPVAFNLSLLGDDSDVNSVLGPVAAEYAVGGKIKLSAQVNDLDQPLRGLNTQPAAQVKVFVVKPGNNLGDVLSDANVQGGSAPQGDQASAAQLKLKALLAADPDALKHANETITLLDNGAAANGDSKADDGRYSALVPADFEGHYQFVFLVEGKSESGGPFVRQQIRTVHVRSLPDPTKTQYDSNIVTTDGGKAVIIVATPKNVLGGKMGPGWANYFWFNAQGQAPVKPKDNLDGTYTVHIPFTGTPPKVSLHFLPEPVYRPDSFVPPAGSLTPGNSIGDNIIDNVPPGPGQPWWKRWWWVILIVLLLLFLLLRRK